MNSARTARPGSAESPVLKLLDTNECADALRLSRRSVQDLVRTRQLGHVKIGRSLRFSCADIAAFVESNRVKPLGWKGRPV